jgi:hypothetical protein
MAGRWRFDPYRNFNFRVAAAALVAGATAFGIGKLLRRKKKRPVGEQDSGPRPIEAVGTSTAGFVGMAPKQARRTSRPRRKPAR